MQTVKLTAAAMVLSALPLFGETMNGDITAAVRASGNVPTISSIPASGNPGSCAVSGLFDGLVSIGDVGYPSIGQRFFFKWTDSDRLVLDYAMPDGFLPGEDVVVTAVVFAVGRAKSDGSGYFTNYDKRMPLAWALEGQDGAGTWQSIASVTNQGGYVLGKYNGTNDVYSGGCDIANTNSYRRYRITVTKNTGDTTYMVQLTEVKLLGFYGGTYSASVRREDLTAAARGLTGIASCEVLSPNITALSDAYALSKAFDGSVTDGGTDRFLAAADSTSAALAGDGAIIEYDFAEETFRNGADVVVTGYTLDTQSSHGDALKRMPKSWAFEAYDAAAGAWVVLDRYENFTYWQRREVDGYEQILFDFTFPNSASYRKYRIRITELNGGSQVQFSEIRLYGYTGKSIAGKVGADDGEGHALDITASGRSDFTPSISFSDCTSVLSGTTLANAFDSSYVTWVLFTLEESHFPFCVTYEIPDSFMPGVDIVVTNYSLSVRNDVQNYNQRSPRSWRLEGYSEEQSRWVGIDTKSSFSDWVDDTEKTCRHARISIEGNRMAFRKYRVRVSSVNGMAGSAWQLQFSEIELGGMWGKGIALPAPDRMGAVLILL